MIWNCPHCQVALSVPDDKIGRSWSFSRCFQCARFALVHPEDTRKIRVERAPDGQSFLLPSGHVVAPHEAATFFIERPTFNPDPKSLTQDAQAPSRPVVRPAQRQPAKAAANPLAKPLPPPLPEVPVRGWSYHLVPFTVGLIGLTAIGSGIYLYRQSQTAWQKARASATLINKEQALASTATTIVDQVHNNAMAPDRDQETGLLIAPTALAPEPDHISKPQSP